MYDVVRSAACTVRDTIISCPLIVDTAEECEVRRKKGGIDFEEPVSLVALVVRLLIPLYRPGPSLPHRRASSVLHLTQK
ncbi:MAG: hypothetical protein OK454_07790, partial [Thaumarchaeota archaeon]|nr:hypothetical protein [Nitrososphaerota archaeon]